jgi:hypothetical protein
VSGKEEIEEIETEQSRGNEGVIQTVGGWFGRRSEREFIPHHTKHLKNILEDIVHEKLGVRAEEASGNHASSKPKQTDQHQHRTLLLPPTCRSGSG